MIEEMLRNSAAQAEGIQRILSELLRFPQADNVTDPHQREPQLPRPRKRQKRVQLDLTLKVGF